MLLNVATKVGSGFASGSSFALGMFGMQLWPTSAYSALQRAKKSAGADGLINATADNQIFYLPPIFPIVTLHVIQLRGTAIKLERGGSLSQ